MRRRRRPGATGRAPPASPRGGRRQRRTIAGSAIRACGVLGRGSLGCGALGYGTLDCEVLGRGVLDCGVQRARMTLPGVGSGSWRPPGSECSTARSDGRLAPAPSSAGTPTRRGRSVAVTPRPAPGGASIRIAPAPVTCPSAARARSRHVREQRGSTMHPQAPSSGARSRTSLRPHPRARPCQHHEGRQRYQTGTQQRRSRGPSPRCNRRTDS